MGRFDGQVAVVTGGAHGIGHATVMRFAGEGAAVGLIDVDEELARASEGELRRAGTDVIAEIADVSDHDALAGALGRIQDQLGPPDVLFANAATYAFPGGAVEQDLEDWDRTLSVNLTGVFLAARLVLPSMQAKRGGAIVMTASTSALRGEDRAAAYCASKGALISLARQLAADYARDGIRVNCVCPGWVQTGFNDAALPDLSEAEVVALVDRTVPMGRQASPEEIAATVAFLSSADASYITGQTVIVDGGQTLW